MLKKSVVIKANKIKPKIKFQFDYRTVLYFTLLICGIIIGVFINKKGSNEWHIFFENLICNYLITKSSNSIFTNFCSIFSAVFIVFLYNYISGLCGVGIPFTSFSPFILGVYYGVILTFYYLSYGFSGIIYCALVNLPLYAITAATLVKCCCESSNISKEIFFYLISGKGEGKPLLKEYTIKYLVYLIPVSAGALISALFFHLFSHLFTFIK